MNKEPNIFIKFWDFLTLKTYHKNLLTSGGSTYLTVISFIMILAALSEGFAWGFLGSTFTPQSPYIGWSIVGGFVFLLMWFFDRSMASADLLKDEHEKTLNGLQLTKESFYSWPGIKSFTAKYFPFAIRIGIVCLSLYITAPFLTQLVFKADIDNKMMEQYKDNIALAKKNGLESRDKKIAELEQLVNKTNEKLQIEISGKSGTGYGRGYVAQSIERQLGTLQSDLNSTRIERESFLTKFDQAVDRGNEEELKKYGITITKDSPIFRQQAIEEFENQKAFNQTKYAVDVFLIILGTILISAKLMQPRTLQMYFSSRLQEKWALYKLGTFDKYLPEQERSDPIATINQSIPEEFEEIIVQYAQDQRERKRQEILILQEKEKLAREKEQKQLKEEERLFTKAREEQELQEIAAAELKKAQQIHFERLAKEKAEIEMREKARVFYEGQILKALNEVEEAEIDYLNKFSKKIDHLEINEERLMEELHDIERTFKNHEDNIEARNKRIIVAETDLADMQDLARKLQRPEENHTIESLRAFTTAESAVVEQKTYIKNVKSSLLTFETDQKYYQENIIRIREQLNKTKVTLAELKEPLEIISTSRSKIEARKMELLGAEGLIDTPYEPHHDAEIPMLVEKLKSQLSTQIPSYMS